MSSRIALIAGGVAALLIAVIVALYFILGGEDEAENAVTTSQQSAPAPAEQVEQAVEQVLPTFDIVRVERDGMAVIAGRATPGAEITLKRNGTAIATVDADARGEWVIVLDEPLAPGDIELTLSAVNPDGSTVDGVQSVSVSVPAQAGGQTLVVLAEPGKASRVLQGPGVPSDSGSLILESVDYDEKGNVIVAGRTDPGSTVRVYLNGGPIGDATADQKGQWELRPSVGIEPGTYTMRIDQLDANGAVVARVEVPFERGVPEVVRQQIAAGRVVIQPGNNLWNIARQLYSSGYRYTVIYQANQDQIRDPNLIYPGQVLETPAR
ncbi:MAG: LysM peptidoglycan-binding domain-containing protein [Alphaproteobacteria bacterium]|nr:LysM peptidoglycan-binding domain-containing protein [Alphaproteobacteria bacterium]MBO6628689.1 LysM peptidoglycan-binding domain-containing protein [Alphaproteobacteria bacterium]